MRIKPLYITLLFHGAARPEPYNFKVYQIDFTFDDYFSPKMKVCLVYIADLSTNE